MSKMLSKIHYNVYNKIKFQEKLNNYLEQNLNDEETSYLINRKYQKLPTLPLEEVIDINNIHAWLQSKIDLDEEKYAYIVGEILKSEKFNIEELKKLIYNFSVNETQSIMYENSIINAKDVYNYVLNYLIEGMPCDMICKIIKEDEHCIIWKNSMDIHKKYWDKARNQTYIYFQLRQPLINGLINNKGYNYKFISIEEQIIEKV